MYNNLFSKMQDRQQQQKLDCWSVTSRSSNKFSGPVYEI